MPRPEPSAAPPVPDDLQRLAARRVGSNRGREVWALEEAGVARYFVKRFLGADAPRRVAREAAVHRRLSELGLPVAEVVSMELECLILAALPGGPLDEELRRRGPGRRRRELAEELGHLLARLHESGHVHGQLFAWHVWVADGRPVGLLDLAELRRARSRRRRLRDFAALFATLGHRELASVDRARLLAAAGLDRAQRRWAAPRIARRRRSLQQRFRYPTSWRGTEHHAAGDRVLLHEALRDEPPFPLDRWLRPEWAELQRERDGRRNQVGRGPDGARWFGKTFLQHGPGRRHAAMQEFGAHRLLQWLGVEVPEVMVVARAAGGASALWTRGVVPGESLRDILHRGGLSAEEARRRLLVVARWARRLHAAGFVHGDLYLDHSLCAEGRIGVVWIDLGRLRETRRRRPRIKDLAALEYSARTAEVSRSLRLRMFREYVGGGRRLLRRARLRGLLRAVLAKADRIEARERRHGRWPAIPAAPAEVER